MGVGGTKPALTSPGLATLIRIRTYWVEINFHGYRECIEGVTINKVISQQRQRVSLMIVNCGLYCVSCEWCICDVDYSESLSEG